MNIADNINQYVKEIGERNCTLVAISKTKPIDIIKEAYDSGQRIFGENKVQELADKYPQLPMDIQWHMVGHLQSNKVKYIAPFVHLIHSVDSIKLLKEIDKQAAKHDRIIFCLLQVHIAEEETKFGLTEEGLYQVLDEVVKSGFEYVKIIGLMGMATYTPDDEQVRREFRYIKDLLETASSKYQHRSIDLTQLSIGMSGDYKIALEEGSTMIRIGTGVFGARH
jgi:pyridoxal phosphate enzyme (YggS family)